MKKAVRKKATVKKYTDEKNIQAFDALRAFDNILYVAEKAIAAKQTPKIIEQLDLIERAANNIGAEQIRLLLNQTPHEIGLRYQQLSELIDQKKATFRDNMEFNFINFFKPATA